MTVRGWRKQSAGDGYNMRENSKRNRAGTSRDPLKGELMNRWPSRNVARIDFGRGGLRG